MPRTNLAFRFRWFLLTLFLANNIKTTHNQYYFIEGKRPVYIIDDTRQSPLQTVHPNPQTSSEAFSGRSLEDFSSSETAEVHYVHQTEPEDLPVVENLSRGTPRDTFTFSHESVDSVETSNPDPKSTSQESSEITNLKGESGYLYDYDDEGRLPEARLFFKGWPLRIEYKESWKGRRQEVKPKPHPYAARPSTSLVDPKFYDSKFYYKYVKKRNKKIKKAKKWQKLSKLIQFKYMKYLKELEELAPDDASIYDSYDGRKLKKSKSKKKKSQKKKKYQPME